MITLNQSVKNLIAITTTVATEIFMPFLIIKEIILPSVTIIPPGINDKTPIINAVL